MKKKILHPKVSGLPSRAQIDISPEKTVTTRVGNDDFLATILTMIVMIVMVIIMMIVLIVVIKSPDCWN